MTQSRTNGTLTPLELRGEILCLVDIRQIIPLFTATLFDAKTNLPAAATVLICNCNYSTVHDLKIRGNKHNCIPACYAAALRAVKVLKAPSTELQYVVYGKNGF
jgi:hypothetical protein